MGKGLQLIASRRDDKERRYQVAGAAVTEIIQALKEAEEDEKQPDEPQGGDGQGEGNGHDEGQGGGGGGQGQGQDDGGEGDSDGQQDEGGDQGGSGGLLPKGCSGSNFELTTFRSKRVDVEPERDDFH